MGSRTSIGEDSSSDVRQYVRQYVDHFNASDERMWNQAYYVNDTYFNVENESAPVFLCVGTALSLLYLSLSLSLSVSSHTKTNQQQVERGHL